MMNLFPVLDGVLNDEFVAVYHNKNKTDLFLAGSVLAWDKDFLALSLVSPDAQQDGVCLCRIPRIFRFERHSQYLENLKLKSDNFEQSSPIICWSDGILNGFLCYMEDRMATIQIEGFQNRRILSGVPLQHTDKHLTIRRICHNGAIGKTYRLCLDKVSLLVCDLFDNTESLDRTQGGMLIDKR